MMVDACVKRKNMSVRAGEIRRRRFSRPPIVLFSLNIVNNVDAGAGEQAESLIVVFDIESCEYSFLGV
jgi:hypothetical protein